MNLCLADNKFSFDRSRPLVTGFGIASASLMDAVIRYSEAERILLLTDGEPSYLKSVQDTVQKIKRKRPDQTAEVISSLSVLFHGPGALGDVDLIHSVKENVLPLLSLRETLDRSVPLTFTLHCLSDQFFISDILFLLSVLPFRPYDAVICSSESVKSTVGRMLERIYSERNYCVPSARIQLRKIPLGIDTDRFHPLDKAVLRKKYDLDPDAFVLLWFGRFSDLFKADLHPLLTVFRNLRARNSERHLQLILAGCEGRENVNSAALMKDAIRLKIDPDIRIVDNRDIPDRNELYNISDVFVSPTDNIQETFGLTPVEAMACGIPQVVSDWDGYRDTVVDGETGFLITTSWYDCMSDVCANSHLPFDGNQRREVQRYLAVRSTAVDCQMMTDRIQQLIDSPELIRKMSAASRKRAVSEYHLSNIIAQKDRLWSELCELASAAPEKEPRRSFTNMIPLDYCSDFRSYPSRYLNDLTVFSLNAEMVADLDSTGIRPLFPIHPYPDLLTELEEEKLIDKVFPYICSMKTVTVSGLSAAFPDATPDQIRRTVMYLYKNNFLIVL